MKNERSSINSVQALKAPPHSIEAEQSVLGGLLLNPDAWEQVSHFLAKEDFYENAHRLIFEAIRELVQKSRAVDVLTVSDFLKSTQNLNDVGGETYLFELAQNTPAIANVTAYAEIVRERAILRQLIAAASEIADQAYRHESRAIIELLDMAERKIFSIARQDNQRSGPMDIQKLAKETLAKVYERSQSPHAITGIKSGFYDLDEMTSGLQKSDLLIVAGRPSMGKTAFAMNIAENIAVRGKNPVLVFSMEMPNHAIILRMLSSLGRVEQGKIRAGRLDDGDWARVQSAVDLLTDTKVFIDDTPALSPNEIRARARRVAKEHGDLDLIVVDYLQLMQVPNNRENRTAEISEISRSLKSLARELNVPVIALSQLNRSLEQRQDRRPMMSDLRESGSIEQDADLILFIYRDEVYNPETADKNIAEIIIAKHRNGPIGKIKLNFRGQNTKFENLATNVSNIIPFS